MTPCMTGRPPVPEGAQRLGDGAMPFRSPEPQGDVTLYVAVTSDVWPRNHGFAQRRHRRFRPEDLGLLATHE